MSSINLSVTSVAPRMGQSLTSDSSIIRLLQKARRNCAAAILSNRINNLAPARRTDSIRKPYRSHAETAQIHAETVPRDA